MVVKKTKKISEDERWLGLAPATLEFWVRFPNERNQGKQAHPVFDRPIVLLLFLQKQNLANAIYLFGLGTLSKVPGSSRVP
jgi:hypothetical protein